MFPGYTTRDTGRVDWSFSFSGIWYSAQLSVRSVISQNSPKTFIVVIYLTFTATNDHAMLYLSDHKTGTSSWWPFIWVLLGIYEFSLAVSSTYLKSIIGTDLIMGIKCIGKLRRISDIQDNMWISLEFYHRFDTPVILERNICEAEDTWTSRPTPSPVPPRGDFNVSNCYKFHRKSTYLWNPCRIVYKGYPKIYIPILICLK